MGIHATKSPLKEILYVSIISIPNWPGKIRASTSGDFYLFDGPSGKTAMAMTVNPDVRLSGPKMALHPEGLYAFRFDLNGDAREEVTFKFRFE